MDRRLVGFDLGTASAHTVRILDGGGQEVCRRRCEPTWRAWVVEQVPACGRAKWMRTHRRGDLVHRLVHALVHGLVHAGRTVWWRGRRVRWSTGGTGWSAVTAWPDVMRGVDAVPPVVWISMMAACLVLTVATWSTARRRVRRAGQRLADPDLAGQGRAKDTALTLASLVPAGLFWVMVLGGSLHGLVAFGHDTLGWRDGWEFLVPGTLDGVSVTFAMLAFRAVKRGKAPDRCYRVVWGAALASATINFAHEYGKVGNALAGGYVALLSLFGMFMFDEFLNQFEEGTERIRRENPTFGIRWLTWPTNTFLAAVAWRNHPPPQGTAGTVANAVANLEQVRAVKLAARRGVRPGAAAADRRVLDVMPAAAEQQMPTALAVRPHPPRAKPAAGARSDVVKVPSTPATVARWAGIWVTMRQRPDLAWSAIQDDELAQERFDVSSRQLRNIRYAALTGALRRQARELAVELPAEFDESAAGPLGGQTEPDRRL